jgi:hypothetical protein
VPEPLLVPRLLDIAERVRVNHSPSTDTEDLDVVPVGRQVNTPGANWSVKQLQRQQVSGVRPIRIGP